MNLYNVGMMHRSHNSCFSFKALDEVGVILQVCMQELNSYVALQSRIKSLPDFGNTSASQTLLQFIFTDASVNSAHARLYSQRTLLSASFLNRSIVVLLVRLEGDAYDDEYGVTSRD